MIKFTLEEITDILNYAVLATDDCMQNPVTSELYDEKVTEYINAKLEAKQIEEDNRSLRKTFW